MRFKPSMLAWGWLLASAACGAETSPQGEPSAAAGSAGRGGPEAGGMAGGGGAGGAAEGVSLPGPCREPAPPHLCSVLPEGVAAESQPLGNNLFLATQRFVAEVVALGGGFTPADAGPPECLPGFAIEAAMARSGTHAEWLELAAGDRSVLVSFSAPPESLGFGLGQTLEVSYSVVDDLLLDFDPKTRSLVIRDADGGLRLWLATSSSVADLNDVAPSEVRLSTGADQCRVVRGCPTYVQQALSVALESEALELTQGDLASTPGWRVLAGQSETLVDSSACKLDGYPALASIGVWRLPD